MDDDKDKARMGQNLVYAIAASQMGFLVAGGLLLGVWADKKFGSMPLCTMIGLVVGFASGIRLLILLVKNRK